MTIRAINNDIIFSFIQEIKNGGFVNTTAWGMEISHSVDDAKCARWATVLHKGDLVEAESIQVGQYILIEPLMWTNKISYEDAYIWKTNETKVLATSVNLPENII